MTMYRAPRGLLPRAPELPERPVALKSITIYPSVLNSTEPLVVLVFKDLQTGGDDTLIHCNPHEFNYLDSSCVDDFIEARTNQAAGKVMYEWFQAVRIKTLASSMLRVTPPIFGSITTTGSTTTTLTSKVYGE